MKICIDIEGFPKPKTAFYTFFSTYILRGIAVLRLFFLRILRTGIATVLKAFTGGNLTDKCIRRKFSLGYAEFQRILGAVSSPDDRPTSEIVEFFE